MPPETPVATPPVGPRGRALKWSSLTAVLVLTVATAFVWIWHYHRWTWEDWRQPTDYGGDALETLARLRAASEGDIVPLQPQVIARLGAPFGAHWNAYPTPDKPLMLALGGLARLTGLFVAANAGLLLAQLTAAWSFYFVARRLRCRREWAVAGALLFAYNYSAFHRGLAHFSLIFNWTVPLGLLAVALIARSRRLHWRGAGAVLCLATGVALGAHNPYNLYFWTWLLGWALLAQWLGARRRANLQIGLATLALAFAVFFATNLEYWLYVDDLGAQPLLDRNYAGTEHYALKPVEMLIPPAFHRWDALAFFGHRYLRWSDWRGEVFLPYLGLAGIAALIWLAATTASKLLRRRAPPTPALAIGWMLLLTCIGGVANVLAFYGGVRIFRATNRVSVFVAAVLLIFLATRLSRLTARWPAWLRIGAAAALAAIGVLDQVPREDTAGARAEIAAELGSDRAFARNLEAALPAGAMVFQYPVIGFPEEPSPGTLGDYELFRPYYHARSLRFSYGAGKARARSAWQRELEAMPLPRVIARLEATGFSALYVNRKAYEDRGESILRELAALGRTRRIDGPQGNQVVVLLKPSLHPQPPLARRFTYGTGWRTRPVQGVRWAYEDASLSYFNPQATSLDAVVEAELCAVAPCRVTLELEGREVGSAEVGPQPQRVRFPGVVMPPGVNNLKLKTDIPAQRPEGVSSFLRNAGVRQMSVHPKSRDGT